MASLVGAQNDQIRNGARPIKPGHPGDQNGGYRTRPIDRRSMTTERSGYSATSTRQAGNHISSHLADTDFAGADLTDTDLASAHLTGTDLSR